MQRSSKWMIYFFIASMITTVGAFISAGAVGLPPVPKLKGTMIGSLAAGRLICSIPLLWILWSIREYFDLSVRKILTCFPAYNRHSETAVDSDIEELKNSLLQKLTKKECEEKFKKWDADGDGYIIKTELLNLDWSGSPHPSFDKRENMLQEEEVDEIMSTVARNADKKIDLKEFQKIFM